MDRILRRMRSQQRDIFLSSSTPAECTMRSELIGSIAHRRTAAEAVFLSARKGTRRSTSINNRDYDSQLIRRTRPKCSRTRQHSVLKVGSGVFLSQTFSRADATLANFPIERATNSHQQPYQLAILALIETRAKYEIELFRGF